MIEFANFLSVLPLYYIIFSGITTIISLFLFTNYFRYQFVYMIGLGLSLFLPEVIKHITKLIHPNNMIWYRPKGAKGCDFRSVKGYALPYTPGFPSGHMTITSYVMIFNILMVLKKNIKYKYLIIFINLLIILLMGWARYYKKCHNLFQISGGIMFGYILSKLTFKFYTKLI